MENAVEKKVSLGELVAQYRDAIESADETALAEAAKLDGDIRAKGGRIAHVLSAIEQEALRYSALEIEAGKRRAALEKKYDWLCNQVKENMRVLGVREIGTPGAKITIGAKAGVQTFRKDIDIETVPAKYLTITPEQTIPESKKINQAAVRDAIDRGDEKPDCWLLPRGETLRVKI